MRIDFHSPFIVKATKSVATVLFFAVLSVFPSPTNAMGLATLNIPPAGVYVPSARVEVHIDVRGFFPKERAYSYGFSGVDGNGNRQCVPGCGSTAYVDVGGGTREFSSYAMVEATSFVAIPVLCWRYFLHLVVVATPIVM